MEDLIVPRSPQRARNAVKLCKCHFALAAVREWTANGVVLSCGARLGPYEIIAPIGSGGMGEVYKGCDTRLDRSPAITLLMRLQSDRTSATVIRFEVAPPQGQSLTADSLAVLSPDDEPVSRA